MEGRPRFSSLCLILAAFSTNLAVVLGLLLIRSALSQMDVPKRTPYVMAVVTPPERPAAASVTAVPRSLASSLSPALAGALLTTSFRGLPPVVCGALKIIYDIALLSSFRHTKPSEERPVGQSGRRIQRVLDERCRVFSRVSQCGRSRAPKIDAQLNPDAANTPDRHCVNRQ